MLVRPEHDHDALVAWAEKRSLLIEPALVCEVRFRAHVRALYDIPMPPRYLSLLAKLVGTEGARAAAGDSARDMRTPTPVMVGLDPVETLLTAARLGDAKARRTALRRLSRRVDDPRVIAFRRALEKRAAQGALVALSCEDAGMKTKRWLDWWAKMGGLSRVEWLLEALAHRNPELRLQASSELYEISGEYFGYHYDLPERDREEARQRWIAWWQSKKQNS